MSESLVPDQVNQLLLDVKDLIVDTNVISAVTNEVPGIRLLEVGNQIWNHYKELKMKKFFRGLSKEIEVNGYSVSNKIKLENYLKDDFTRASFFNILDNALEASSELCSEMLGYYAGLVLQSSERLSYNHTIIINALKNLNDWDLINFKKAYEFFTILPDDQPINSICLYKKVPLKSLEKDKDEMEKLIYDEEFNAFKSTIIKLANLQVFNTSQIVFSADPHTYTKTKASDEMFHLVKLFV